MSEEELEAILANQGLQLRPLDGDHFVDYFSCGRDPKMDEWLANHAMKWQSESFCKVHVLSSLETPGDVMGFFTLSSSQLVSVPKDLRAEIVENKEWVSNLDAPFPASLLGKFALREDLQKKGFAKLLMVCVYVHHISAARSVGSKFLILDARVGKLVEYYEREFGFIQALHSEQQTRMVKSTKAVGRELKAIFSD